ncbi:MAG TPA: NAD(P)/FAD-dependent oxidoreductase [Polyangia bacterium]
MSKGTSRMDLGERVDLVVIGGGVIGCAIAAAAANSNRQVVLLERERGLGSGITSRNSGVIHSGLYYPPGSLKARSCVRGNRRLYAWAAAHGVWHARVGKLVVAKTSEQEAELQRLWENARASGAPDVSLLTGAAVQALEPTLQAVAGLHCAATGIVDPHELVLSLRAAAERAGAVFVTGAAVTGIDAGGEVRVETTRGEITAAQVVNAAGMAADELARLVGVSEYRHHPCRGDYFRLRTQVGYRHLVYPVRDPRAPGLGVHLTLERGGGMRLGPDTTYVDRRDDFSDAAPDKHGAFLAAAQRLLGPLHPDQLQYDGCGIRPKLRAPDDTEEKDFVVCEHPRGIIHLLGIESPGLTAALDLAAQVTKMLS